jgi:putative transposase
MSITEILSGYEPDQRGHRRPESLYGSLKIWAHLRRQGVPLAHSTVERGDASPSLARGNTGENGTHHHVRPDGATPPDLVNRQFSAERPDQLWVADFT